eukprot:scaffold13820_cov87-Phaeocystis_antarctica.AAC.1
MRSTDCQHDPPIAQTLPWPVSSRRPLAGVEPERSRVLLRRMMLLNAAALEKCEGCCCDKHRNSRGNTATTSSVHLAFEREMQLRRIDRSRSISYGLLYSEVPATPRVISYRKSDVPRW